MSMVSRISPSQKELMFSYLLEYPEMIHNILTPTFTKQHYDNLWKACGKLLNLIGPSKNCQQWKSCWLDLKSTFWKKANIVNQMNSGDVNSPMDNLTQLEQNLYDVMMQRQPINLTNEEMPSTSMMCQEDLSNYVVGDVSPQTDSEAADLRSFIADTLVTQNEQMREEKKFHDEVKQHLQTINDLLRQILANQQQIKPAIEHH